jgi:hypothetical protein
MPADLGVIAVAAGVVGRGMVAQAIGERLDEGRPKTVSGPRQRLLNDGTDRDDIVAVNLLARDARRYCLLRERLGGGLTGGEPRSPRHCC